jgi:acetyl esterase/lipase
VGGSVEQFFPHCEHFAAKGMVAISAEYRTKNKHGTTPFECVADGKSAIRYVRAHAKALGIDPARIVASGGSAGGHVAACTGIIEGFDEDTEDKSVSSKPNAMVLFNPVIDTTERGYGANKLKGQETTLSPVHHVVSGLAPTIIFHGTADTTVPFENVERFCRKMNEAGNECHLVPYAGMKHGFFNYKKEKDHKSFNDTVRHTEEFLRKGGYLR